MEAGKLRYRVTLQRPIQSQHPDTGAITTGWENVTDLWARIEALSGRDMIAAQQHQSAISARIVIRRRERITSAMRILYKGDIYVIEAEPLADNINGREYLTLLVSRGPSQE